MVRAGCGGQAGRRGSLPGRERRCTRPALKPAAAVADVHLVPRGRLAASRPDRRLREMRRLAVPWLGRAPPYPSGVAGGPPTRTGVAPSRLVAMDPDKHTTRRDRA